jgi:hypothetical protein
MNKERQARLPIVTLVIMAALLLPVLYTLAAGPIHGLLIHGYIPEESSAARGCRTLYAPMLSLLERCEPAARAFKSYLDLWD